MGIRNHREKAEGRRSKARMPKPTEVRMGTRIHESEDYYDEEVPEIDRCEKCGGFFEVDDINYCEEQCAPGYFGLYICYKCEQKVEQIIADYDEEIYGDALSED